MKAYLYLKQHYWPPRAQVLALKKLKIGQKMARNELDRLTLFLLSKLSLRAYLKAYFEPYSELQTQT